MDILRIKSVLLESSSRIKGEANFTDRMRIVYEVLDEAFPPTTQEAAIYGPITSMGDFMSRTEIEQLLQTIQESARTGVEYVSTDIDLDKALAVIYEHVK